MTEHIERIIGMNIEEAKSFLKDHGFSLRVMQRDGKHLVGTCDIRTNRLNVSVKDDKITGLLRIG